MKISELFVDISIQGADKAKQTLVGVRSGVNDIASTSLEAKAAILGMLYGINSLISGSTQAGQNLVNFNTTTGFSIKRLQEFQFAGKQVGTSAEETAGSVANLQQKMMDLYTHQGGAPEGFGMLQNIVGLPKEGILNTEAMFMKLQEMAQKYKDNPAFISKFIKSFGISEGVFAAMLQNKFNENIFSKAPKYSEATAKSLANMRAQFSNIGSRFETGIGVLATKHLPKLMPQINELIPKILSVADAFGTLLEKTKFIEIISKSLEGWGKIFDFFAFILEKSGTGWQKLLKEGGKPSAMSDFKEYGAGFIGSLIKNQMPYTWTHQPAGTIVTQTNNIHVNEVKDGMEQVGNHLDKTLGSNAQLRNAQASGRNAMVK